MKKQFLFLLLLCSTTFAQWATDPSTNLAVCTSLQTQRETETCIDNQGNIYIFWRDYRNEPTLFAGDIYAQKLNSNGEAQWSVDGLSMVTKPAAQFDVKALFDGDDGIYLVWRESIDLFSDYKIYAQRITLGGSKLWGNYGILLQNTSGKAVSHSISLSEDGGLLVSWQLNIPTISSVDIYAQKISRSGIIQWTNNGVIICNATGRHLYGSNILSDQKGGAYITWSDNRTDFSNFDIYAQRISSNGNILWAQNGIPICTKTGNQTTKHLIPDNDGGIIIFWEDTQESSYSIYVQKIDSSGNKLYEPDGNVVISNSTPVYQYEFILDKNKEIFFLWSTIEGDIYAQKLDYDGKLIWNNSLDVCVTKSSVSYLAAYPSDVNGIVVAWLDKRSSNNDVYCQWINSDGIARWKNNGTTICNESSEQADYSISSDFFGGAVVAWADMRNGNFDIYSQNIDIRGKLGTNKYLFQKNGLSKIISHSESVYDSLLITLPLQKNESADYNITVLIDSIFHPDVTEIKITLKHLGIIDTIIYELSGGENIINCLLDDYAMLNISSSIPPYSGIYKPYKPLTAFLGTDLSGEWIIEIEDSSPGDDGTLKSWGLVFSKGEVTDVESSLSILLIEDYSLEQNYPNPFNPSTKISWQSPVGSHQTIKVYDVLGNEIVTLVNEYKPAGTYEVEFNPSTVKHQPSSGVYFYQLKAGEFIQTKKMVLLR